MYLVYSLTTGDCLQSFSEQDLALSFMAIINREDVAIRKIF